MANVKTSYFSQKPVSSAMLSHIYISRNVGLSEITRAFVPKNVPTNRVTQGLREGISIFLNIYDSWRNIYLFRTFCGEVVMSLFFRIKILQNAIILKIAIIIIIIR